jgi:MoxR-like ATPase
VLRHRLVLTYEALSDDVDADLLVNAILAAIPLPDVPLRDRVGALGAWPPPVR